MTKRRNFLKHLVTGSLAAMALPSLAESAFLSARESLASGDVTDEAYWRLVKQQFSVPQNLIMFNAANLCPCPYVINDVVDSALKGLGRDVSFQYRSQFEKKRAVALEMMAKFIGVTKDELGIVRNASEANTIIVQGLDLKAGDEIVLWDQNHPSNNVAWEQRAKRIGFIVKKVSVPQFPESIEQLIEPFAKAITAKTKLISFSHISNTSGMMLPAKEIAQLARSKKILTMVDGAQSLGLLDMDINALGLDFYTASTHKWLMGPHENGILYVKQEHISKVVPNIVSAGWKDTSTTVDQKLCIVGQRNEISPFAIPESIQFQSAIGKKNIEDRVKKLNAYLREQITVKIPSATFVSPSNPAMLAGIVIINLPGKTPADVNQKLYSQYGIAVAPSGGIRMSPHIYNTMDDIDKVVSALAATAA